MLTLNQSSGDNNETIWVLKINTPTPIYLATRDLTLDSTFDGQVLNFDNYLTPLVYNSSIESSGGTGSVTSFSFSISRHVENTALNGFFDEFYPATSGIYLSAVVVQIGICWTGASADTDITWLFTGRVISYDYEQRQINITVFQESEITNKEIPYYSVQKDFNNGVSYFTHAPEESYGSTIPIVYGNLARGFKTADGDYGVYIGYVVLAPCIPVHKRLTKFIVSSHECHTVSEDEGIFASSEIVWKYIKGIQAYLYIRNLNFATDSSTINNNSGHLLSITNRGSRLVGTLVIRLAEQSEMSDVVDVDNAIDQNLTTYSELDAVAGGNNKLALRTIGSAATEDVGYLGIADEEIGCYFRASSDGAVNRDFTINYFNNTLPTPAGDTSPTSWTSVSTTSGNFFHQFGANNDGKKEDSYPWTIEEICSLDYYIENNQTTPSEEIRVYNAYLFLANIKVFSPNYARRIRQEGNGGRGK